MIVPVITEKSLAEAKKGRYTFWVDVGATKGKIRKLAEKLFGVDVVSVATLLYKGGRRRSVRGVIQSIKSRKKAIVGLEDGQKIDLFEEKK